MAKTGTAKIHFSGNSTVICFPYKVLGDPDWPFDVKEEVLVKIEKDPNKKGNRVVLEKEIEL